MASLFLTIISPMGSVQFNKQNNRLGRAAAGEDHISGLLAYCDVLPKGLFGGITATPGSGSTVFSWVPVDGATAYRYVLSGNAGGGGNATANQSSFTLLGTPAAGAIFTLYVTVGGIETLMGSVTTTLVTTSGITKRILELNSLTQAENAGLKLETVTDPTLKKIAYHVREFYRIRPNAKLFLGIYPVPTGLYTFNEVGTMRLFAVGKIKQLAVYNAPLSQANVQLLQAQYNDAENAKQMLEILFGPNLANTATNAFTDLSVMLSPNVHIIAAQDGSATGNALFIANPSLSVTAVGAALGTMALAAVNENIGWVEKFNMALVELEVPALANGTLISSLDEGTLADLESKRYIFLKKYTDVSGTFWNDSHGCCAVDDDYAYAEDNRAMDKAIRDINKVLTPKINGPVLLDPSNGQLRYQYVKYLELEASKALEEMANKDELSGYEVSIDPDQDVNATSTIVIEVTNVKVGVSRNLVVNIGY